MRTVKQISDDLQSLEFQLKNYLNYYQRQINEIELAMLGAGQALKSMRLSGARTFKLPGSDQPPYTQAEIATIILQQEAVRQFCKDSVARRMPEFIAGRQGLVRELAEATVSLG